MKRTKKRESMSSWLSREKETIAKSKTQMVGEMIERETIWSCLNLLSNKAPFIEKK
jgi:hypothetical protein